MSAPDLFSTPVAAINVGLGSFRDDLVAQGVPTVQMSWSIPDPETLAGQVLAARLLEKLDGQEA